MPVSLKHQKNATLPDSTDPRQVQPSDWNHEHTLTQGPAVLLGRADNTPGQAPTVEIALDPATLIFQDAMLKAVTPPISGPAGGVLAGTYPNPTFAVDPVFTGSVRIHRTGALPFLLLDALSNLPDAKIWRDVIEPDGNYARQALDDAEITAMATFRFVRDGQFQAKNLAAAEMVLGETVRAHGEFTAGLGGSGEPYIVYNDGGYTAITLNGQRVYTEMIGFEADPTGADKYLYVNMPADGGLSVSLAGASIIDLDGGIDRITVQYEFLFVEGFKTGAPGSGSASAKWQFGTTMPGTVALDTTRSVFVTIDGVLVKLAVAV